MVEIRYPSPEDAEIQQVFFRKLDSLVEAYRVHDQASLHGESNPQLAEDQEYFLRNVGTRDPEGIALILQAMGAAAIATVREYYPEASGSR